VAPISQGFAPVDEGEPVAAGVFPLEQYRTLVESSPLLMWRAGPGGQRDYFNETWLRFTGRSLRQELADGWIEGVHPDDSARSVENYLDHVRKREAFELEFRLRRHDGVYRIVCESGMPFYEEVEFRGFLGACWDVQRRRDAENAQGSFLRMMRHELRTPLQSLSMFVELMRRESERGRPSPSESFSKAKAQLDRLSRLVTDLTEDEPGRGAPAVAGPDVPRELTGPGHVRRRDPRGPGNKRAVSRILIVDDDMSILDALGTLLRKRYDVLMATNGEEAVDRLGSLPVDLVVLDMRMPLLDGEGTLREIRGRGLRVPVIVASARSDQLATFRALGADDFIQKPFDVGVLEEKIDRLLTAAC
jgi:PAS domain S-box-containing protein